MRPWGPARASARRSGYATVPTLYYIKSVGLPLPPDDVASAHAAAFLVSVCAMWIADILLELVVGRLKPQADQ